MNRRQIRQIEKILEDKLIKVGVHCAFICDHDGKVLVRANMEDKVSKLIGHSVSTVADQVLVAIKSVADQMARFLGERTNFSLLLHKENEESIWVNEITDELLLGTISGNEIPVGVLRIKVTETINTIRDILFEREENLTGKTVEILVDRKVEIEGGLYVEGKTAKMQDVRLLLPEDEDVEVGDYVSGKIVESREALAIGLVTRPD